MISYKPLKIDQKQMVIEWLHKPHVNEWFHGQGLQNTINGIDAFLNNKDKWFEAWVAYYKEVPFAFIMSFELGDEDMNDPSCHQAKWMEKGKKTIGIDLLIGEENYLGKGLAVHLIQTFISTVYPDAEVVFIDPELMNTRAIHVYEKVGFKKLEEFIASWHPVPHVLMRLIK